MKTTFLGRSLCQYLVFSSIGLLSPLGWAARDDTSGKAYEAATADLNAGRPLPGLPNLNAPVYVARLTLVCPSLRSLGNPNIEMLILTGTCIAQKPARVAVVVPSDARTYLEAHMLRAVAITWRSQEMSKANAGYGWIKIEDLRN